MADDDIDRELERLAAGQEVRVLPAPSDPMAVARALIDERYRHESGELVLRHWRGGWWRWRTSHWIEVEHRAVQGDAYRFCEHASYANPKDELVAWAPNRHKIADLLEAMTAVTYLPDALDQPAWIDTIAVREGVIVSCTNGLLHVQTRELLEHTPLFFNQTAVPFDYDDDAGDPVRWLNFLDELWEDDAKSIAALQEFMGYTIEGATDLQKILLTIGPTRGGKGTISRVTGELVGAANVCGPTLSSLGNDFGLAPLIGKPLAVISDARLNGRSPSAVVERLLAISGEDTITVNRKYREQWSGKLPTRFIVLSNELPHFGDASHAVVGRFVILQMTRSWLGNEDHDLEPEIHRELPAILNWTLDGLDRLRATNRFTIPDAMDDAVIMMQELASPVSAFVRDRCTRGFGEEVPCDELYAAWKQWADDNGHKPGATNTLGRNLRAVIPGLRVTRPRAGDDRTRVYLGLSLQ